MPPPGGGLPAAAPRDAFSGRGSEERSGWGAPRCERVVEAGQGFFLYPGQYFVISPKLARVKECAVLLLSRIGTTLNPQVLL